VRILASPPQLCAEKPDHEVQFLKRRVRFASFNLRYSEQGEARSLRNAVLTYTEHSPESHQLRAVQLLHIGLRRNGAGSEVPDRFFLTAGSVKR
jgi:hypothetical protein